MMSLFHTSIFDANFAILLSFLVCAGLIWRNLAKPTKAVLDQQIQNVVQTIHDSAQACVTAQASYVQAQKYAAKVHNDIQELQQRTEVSLEKISEQAQSQLKIMMEIKNKAHQSKIEQLENEKTYWLKAATAKQTIVAFQTILQQKVHPTELASFTDYMVDGLKER